VFAVYLCTSLETHKSGFYEHNYVLQAPKSITQNLIAVISKSIGGDLGERAGMCRVDDEMIKRRIRKLQLKV
jgi:hypothetical protein